MEDTTDIAVVGPTQLCLGFGLAGVTHRYPTEDTAFTDAFDTALANGHDLIITRESAFNTLPDRRQEELQDSVNPVIVTLSHEPSAANLQHKTQQAIGIDIWQ